MAQQSPPKLETSAGGVVFRCTARGPEYLLILDAYRNWGFPKGHVHEQEAGSEAARREIMEETGLTDLALYAPLGTIDWSFRRWGQRIHKYCHYYLFESRSGEAIPQEDEGITACAWCLFAQAVETLTYDNARDVLRRANVEVPNRCAQSGPTRADSR